MFKFLKEKLKGAVKKFSKDVEEESEDIPGETVEVPEEPKIERPKKEKPKAKPIVKKPRPVKVEPLKEERPDDIEEVPEPIIEDIITPEPDNEPEPPMIEEIPEQDIIPEPPKPKKGFFGRLFGKKEETEELPAEQGPTEMIEELPEEEPEVEEKLEEEVLEEEDRLIADIDEEKEKVEEDLKVDDEDLAEEDLQVEQPVEDLEEEEQEPEKKGFFSKIKETVSAKTLSEAKFEDLFFELEIALLENNVAIEVIERIKQDLKENLVDKKLNRFEIEQIISKTLKKSIDQILTFDKVDIISKVKAKGEPFSIVFVGINGSGKTTTIAKMARYLMDNNLKVVFAAADTFRAAAIQQLEEHANRLGVKIIKHDYGSDPAAVAFDAIKYAKAKGVDVVMIDTAGRLHSNANLMDEMRKIIRVASPDMKIFIGESITGNDCVEQAQKFNETVGLDGIVLSKADVDEKGGAALSVSFVTKKPILFLGTGQEYKDLKPFSKKEIMENLGL